MQYQAEAERLKRRDILISEGKKQADINIAEG
jgi:regulator of protease activity HflC (stomatin/prohibitin superfamily)